MHSPFLVDTIPPTEMVTLMGLGSMMPLLWGRGPERRGGEIEESSEAWDRKESPLSEVRKEYGEEGQILARDPEDKTLTVVSYPWSQRL